MNQYNPNIHHRRSIRLRGYDYSQAGLYFITICVHDRACLFGEITNGKMALNDVGIIADNFWLEIPGHFPHAELHEYIVMPNHVHGIIEIIKNQHGMPDVGPRHDAGPHHGVALPDNNDITVGTSHGMSGMSQPPNINQFGKPVPGSVSVIINQYKSSVKRWCNKNGHPFFQWQSRFHDHVISDEQSYQRISDYIANNPQKWIDDTFNTFTNN